MEASEYTGYAKRSAMTPGRGPLARSPLSDFSSTFDGSLIFEVNKSHKKNCF
jgi:hypothetical protein